MSIRLTPAQQRVLPLVRDGLPYATIAHHLGLGVKTVKNHVYAIADKIGPSGAVPPYRRVQMWASKP